MRSIPDRIHAEATDKAMTARQIAERVLEMVAERDCEDCGHWMKCDTGYPGFGCKLWIDKDEEKCNTKD